MANKRDTFSECNPIIQFLFFAVVILTTMFISHPVILLLSFFGAFSYNIFLLGIRKVLKFQFLCCIPMFLIVALINPAFNHYGVTILFYLHTGPVTMESLVYGLVLAVMLWVAVIWFSNVNQVMTTDRFVYLFGRFTPALSLVLSMVFRLVPRYRKRLQVIRNGQKCLGRDIHSKNIVYKMKSGIDELSILVSWALENGIDTADSMRARGYGVAKRTSYSIFRFRLQDKIVAAVGMLLYGISVYGFWRGNSFAQYNPQIMIQGVPLSWESALTYLAWFLFAMLPVELYILDKFFQEVRL